jgi:hypothetical protein
MGGLAVPGILFFQAAAGILNLPIKSLQAGRDVKNMGMVNFRFK